MGGRVIGGGSFLPGPPLNITIEIIYSSQPRIRTTWLAVLSLLR